MMADVVLVKPPSVIYAELKSKTGRLTAEQNMWIDALRGCQQEVYVWQPRDMDAIIERLRKTHG